MAHFVKISLIVIFGLVVCSSSGFGQSPTGAVNGTVTDATGAVVPGVTLTLTNMGTGLVFHVSTNTSGVYALVNLAPGMYTLSAEKTGFKIAFVPAFEVT